MIFSCKVSAQTKAIVALHFPILEASTLSIFLSIGDSTGVLIIIIIIIREAMHNLTGNTFS